MLMQSTCQNHLEELMPGRKLGTMNTDQFPCKTKKEHLILKEAKGFFPSSFSYSLCTKTDCLTRKLNQQKGMAHWRSEVRGFHPLGKQDIQYNGMEGKGFHFLTISVQLSSSTASK